MPATPQSDGTREVDSGSARARTSGSATDTPAVPTISLPKGGGAIKGVEEKFSANPVTGTGTLTVPIYTTGSRSSCSPQLSLAYDSGAGNGPFGLGWSLSVPSITRKTEKGLPRYHDPDDSDVFILSGAEDLVPALTQTAQGWEPDVSQRVTADGVFTVRRYRPRIEGLFARIERWHHQGTGDVHWRSIAKDNVTGVYGISPGSRISDPDNTDHVFTWLLEHTFDDKGNIILYQYKAESGENVDPLVPQERNRLGGAFAHRYLKRIKYGNETPYRPDEDLNARTDWTLEVVFDYGEHDAATPTPDEVRAWPCRPDAFSSFRSGFEIRTYRLCRRILVFHSFSELGAHPCLVRSTDIIYAEQPVGTYLTAATQTGYIRDDKAGGYHSQSLPPLTFTYTEAKVDDRIRDVDAASLQNLPGGIDGSRYRWVDLESEGLSGILTEQGGAWFYKHNMGEASFGPTQVVATRPAAASINSSRQQLMDLAGDGLKCLVDLSKPLPGFYERTEEGGWTPFTPFPANPNLDWSDPNLRFIDLDGDGLADVLLSEDEVFTSYLSLARDGFGAPNATRKPIDDERGPALVFADATQSVFLADMTGDGLSDIVRIVNGGVWYWPNRGYGRFGAKVTMDAAPVFDYPDQFEHRRIRLADIDGSGTTDLLYLGSDTVSFWFNQAGNSWSAAHELGSCPPIDNLAEVSVVDLLGQGTACLVWSSSLPGDASRPVRYVDLMGGTKPHLLTSVDTNMGKVTAVQYAPSTRFYLDDLRAGTPWVTKLPFPVHAVERVQTRDEVTDTKLVTLYRYHHGYYDGEEREFRGFGLVEQWDTESFAAYAGAGLLPGGDASVDQELHVPPIRTRTWFHTGAYLDRENIAQHFAHEYYAGDPLATLLPDTTLPPQLSVEEEREACRSLKGRILRQEVYAEDGTASEAHPYSVVEHSYEIRTVQPRQGNPHAVFFAHDREALTYHYERNPRDPRMSHVVTLEVDAFGNVLREATIGYARRPPEAGRPAHEPEQTRPLITVTEHDFVNVADQTDWYRIGTPYETRTWELTGAAVPDGQTLLTVDTLCDAIAAAAAIPYESTPNETSEQKRLIACTRTLYMKNDLSGSLPLGRIESLALLAMTLKMALTPGALAAVYGTRVDDSVLRSGGYGKAADYKAQGLFPGTEEGGTWWIPADRPLYFPNPSSPDPAFARDHFYLLQGISDPFGNVSKLSRDGHNLLVVWTEDALGNTVLAQNSYRTMQPEGVTDPNGNRTAVRFDALGMVTATAAMGKAGQSEGDTLDDPTTRLEYDLFHWQKAGRPNYVHTLAREQHGKANPRWQETYSYTDGLGREVMKKVQAEAGPAPKRDGKGALQLDSQNKPVLEFTNARWVGTGRTVFDNKGNAVKKYEPFFSSTPEYEDEKDLVEWGVTPVLHYDPPGRLVRTDHPDGTLARVELDPWEQISWDGNDTILESRWHADRRSLPADSQQRQADDAAVLHANTPAAARLDPLGRTFLTIEDNGPAGKYETRLELDIEGKQRSMTDARGRKVMTSEHDMAGRVIHQVSVDSGERRMLQDVKDRPIHLWDGRDHHIRHEYDALGRPVRVSVRQGAGAEKLVELIVYGEVQPMPESLNLRGRIVRHHDGAGILTNSTYDFKGNLLSSSRQLLENYRDEVDWSGSPGLESETFAIQMTYDALNRPVTMTTPDGSVSRPTYNEANLVEQVSVSLLGAKTATAFVTNIDYNARGQRELIEYGNGTRTAYAYDDKTFRLTGLKTTRTSDGAVLQDLSYTYDPMGNVTHIGDAAQQTIFFKNAKVAPVARYTYDAIYRLIRATGREHTGQVADAQPQYDANDFPRVGLPHPNDGTAMRSYTETYDYDAVGNIVDLIHTVAGTTPLN